MIQLIKIYHQIGVVFLLQYLYLCSGIGYPNYIGNLQVYKECSVLQYLYLCSGIGCPNYIGNLQAYKECILATVPLLM